MSMNSTNLCRSCQRVCHVKNNCFLCLLFKLLFFQTLAFVFGWAYQHVAADGRTFNNFMKTWASFCSFGDSFSIKSLPCFDRRVILDSHGLEGIFLKEWWKRRSSKDTVAGNEANASLSDMVRATFVVGSTDMERIKTWIIAECKKDIMCRFQYICQHTY